jgi:hypothetical protein
MDRMNLAPRQNDDRMFADGVLKPWGDPARQEF